MLKDGKSWIEVKGTMGEGVKQSLSGFLKAFQVMLCCLERCFMEHCADCAVEKGVEAGGRTYYGEHDQEEPPGV
jgi:hypothetical protein